MTDLRVSKKLQRYAGEGSGQSDVMDPAIGVTRHQRARSIPHISTPLPGVPTSSYFSYLFLLMLLLSFSVRLAKTWLIEDARP